MTAKFPTEEYTPREVENIPNVTFDELDTQTLFAEDVNAINDEVVEIENRLKPDTDTPLPYGFRVGTAESFLTFKPFEQGTAIFPSMESSFEVDAFGKVMIVQNSMIYLVPEGGLSGLFFFRPSDNTVAGIFYIPDSNLLNTQASFSCVGTLEDTSISVGTANVLGEQLFIGTLSSDYQNNRAKFNEDILFEKDVAVSGAVDVTGVVNGIAGFKSGTNVGQSTSLTYVVDTRTNGGVLQKRTAVMNFVNGIFTGMTGLSGWVNADNI